MRLTLSIFLVSGFCSLIGQKPFYYIEESDTINIDTLTLEGIEEFGLSTGKLNLGNIGSPEFNLLPGFQDFSGNDYSSLTRLARPARKKYSVFKPVTDARYIIGTSEEQYFNIIHTQNFSRNSNFSIGLDRINSKGRYQNLSTNSSNIYFNFYLDDHGKRNYSLEVNPHFNRNLASLNGGIKYDSAFVQDVNGLRNRELLEVNLLNASQSIRKIGGEVSHSFDLLNSTDSLGNGNKLRFYQNIELYGSKRNYYDTILDADYYNSFVLDSFVTNDDVIYNRYATEIGAQFTSIAKNSSEYSIGIKPSINNYKQHQTDTSVMDLDIVVHYELTANNLKLNFSGDYLLNDGYALNDFHAKFCGLYGIGKYQLGILGKVKRDRPLLDLLNYTGNSVVWENSFGKQSLYSGEGFIKREGAFEQTVSIEYLDVQNPWYFGYDGTPFQAIGFAQLIRTSYLFNGRLGDRWSLSGRASFQSIGGYDVFNVPTFFANFNSSYLFFLFKKKLRMAIGGEVNFFNSYKSKDFDPISGQFIISENREIGGYPYANLFVKGRIQRATFFFSLNHPHQGLLGYDYFAFNHQPNLDRVFRIGVSWLFLN